MNTFLLSGFDAARQARHCIRWIRDWFQANGPLCAAVVGVSGGKDSTVCAALCAEALGKERVVGVTMPNKIQPDLDDSLHLVEFLGIRHVHVDISCACQPLLDTLSTLLPGGLSPQTRINLPPRIRMATLYAVSQTVDGRVANTCNLSEDWVGYSTRYGDAAGDFSPLGAYTASEVVAMGQALGVPALLTDKAPSDGLTGRTDEDNLGFTYATLDCYIRTGECPDGMVREAIDRRHKANLFKLRPIPRCHPAP